MIVIIALSTDVIENNILLLKDYVWRNLVCFMDIDDLDENVFFLAPGVRTGWLTDR